MGGECADGQKIQNIMPKTEKIGKKHLPSNGTEQINKKWNRYIQNLSVINEILNTMCNLLNVLSVLYFARGERHRIFGSMTQFGPNLS